MRIKDLAYEVGITRQELRQEFQKTNFGIDPHAREVSDDLALGIIRFLAPKYKNRKKELMKKEAAKRKAEEMVNNGQEFEENKKTTEEDYDETKDEDIIKEEVKKAIDKDGITGPVQFYSSIVVERKKKKFEEEKKEKEKERKKILEEKKQKKVGYKEGINIVQFNKDKIKDVGKNVLNVTRKIEVSDDEINKSKKKKKKGKTQEHIRKALKRFRVKAISENEVDSQDKIALFAEESMRRELEDEAFKASQAKRSAKVQMQKKIEEKMIKKRGIIEIPSIISVKEFSEKTGVPASLLIKTLLKNGIIATMNMDIDYETWSVLSDDLDVKVKKQEVEHSIEDILSGDLVKLMVDEPENLIERPPVVVVMGHVDHGKTSILDYYRNTSVVAGESGGITQHVGAYQVEKMNKFITFIDTPGHEAFTEMRARGAKVTDIAVLVVAADEGVKEQSREAYNHAKEAGVPIIVAINKIDKDEANVEKVKGELMELGLIPEEYSGDTMMVPVSAKSGVGMDNLLESILLQAEVLELKANPNRKAIATVVESHLDKAMGAIATLIVNTGTLKIGDVYVAGSIVGKVRTIYDPIGKKMNNILPSGVGKISGFESFPRVGDIIQVLDNDKAAREKAQRVADLRGEREGHSGLGMSEIISRIQAGKMKFLKVVLKADTIGSLEVINQSFARINSMEVGVKVIHCAVGGVSESDVMMAAASQGIVIGFNVGVPARVKQSAERENVELQIYTVIYNLMDDVKKILTGMLSAEEIEIETGKAEIKAVFLAAKKKQIIGVKVTSGSIINKGKATIFRKNEKLFTTIIDNLRSFDKDVKEIKAENECGIQFLKKYDVEEGDILICTKMEKKMKTL